MHSTVLETKKSQVPAAHTSCGLSGRSGEIDADMLRCASLAFETEEVRGQFRRILELILFRLFSDWIGVCDTALFEWSPLPARLRLMLASYAALCGFHEVENSNPDSLKTNHFRVISEALLIRLRCAARLRNSAICTLMHRLDLVDTKFQRFRLDDTYDVADIMMLFGDDAPLLWRIFCTGETGEHIVTPVRAGVQYLFVPGHFDDEWSRPSLYFLFPERPARIHIEDTDLLFCGQRDEYVSIDGRSMTCFWWSGCRIRIVDPTPCVEPRHTLADEHRRECFILANRGRRILSGMCKFQKTCFACDSEYDEILRLCRWWCERIFDIETIQSEPIAEMHELLRSYMTSAGILWWDVKIAWDNLFPVLMRELFHAREITVEHRWTLEKTLTTLSDEVRFVRLRYAHPWSEWSMDRIAVRTPKTRTWYIADPTSVSLVPAARYMISVPLLYVRKLVF